jgi:hypothetical protein
MATATASASMQIDILRSKDSDNILRDCKALREIDCFINYGKDKEQDLPLREVVIYIVILYSKDSFLNKKPMEPLHMRRIKAASYAGLEAESDTVKAALFDLSSDRIRELILGYLIHQNQMIWMERCIIEAQILENQRIRFKPITNKVVAPVTNGKRKKGEEDLSGTQTNLELDDDKYIVEASSKKATLTDHFDQYYEKLKKYDLEIFADHENVKEKLKKTRVSIESLAS